LYLAEIDGLFVDNIFLYKAFFVEIDVSKPLVNQGLWKERVSFLEANLRGACWSRMLHENKIVTSDVDITVVLVVKVKIKKSGVKIFQKRWQDKIF